MSYELQGRSYSIEQSPNVHHSHLCLDLLYLKTANKQVLHNGTLTIREERFACTLGPYLIMAIYKSLSPLLTPSTGCLSIPLIPTCCRTRHGSTYASDADATASSNRATGL